MKLLPQLTPMNEWFWTSGSDGVLRIQRCDDCGAYRHPPSPICPECRSMERTAAEMSGEGTIVALTLNSGVGTPFGDMRMVRIATAACRSADRRG